MPETAQILSVREVQRTTNNDGGGGRNHNALVAVIIIHVALATNAVTDRAAHVEERDGVPHEWGHP